MAGDLTARDTKLEHEECLKWLNTQPYSQVILIAGNHDNYMQDCSCEGFVKYLCDSGTEFEGLKIWGSPWTRTFEGMNPHCKAFTLDTEEELAVKFSLIPADVDILITHSPPFMIRDTTYDGRHVGSPTLYQLYLQPKRPKLHVFGHVHEAYGKHYEGFHFNCDSEEITEWGILSVNASHVNEHYKPVNKPIRVIL